MLNEGKINQNMYKAKCSKNSNEQRHEKKCHVACANWGEPSHPRCLVHPRCLAKSIVFAHVRDGPRVNFSQRTRQSCGRAKGPDMRTDRLIRRKTVVFFSRRGWNIEYINIHFAIEIIIKYSFDFLKKKLKPEQWHVCHLPYPVTNSASDLQRLRSDYEYVHSDQGHTAWMFFPRDVHFRVTTSVNVLVLFHFNLIDMKNAMSKRVKSDETALYCLQKDTLFGLVCKVAGVKLCF